MNQGQRGSHLDAHRLCPRRQSLSSCLEVMSTVCGQSLRFRTSPLSHHRQVTDLLHLLSLASVSSPCVSSHFCWLGFPHQTSVHVQEVGSLPGSRRAHTAGLPHACRGRHTAALPTVHAAPRVPPALQLGPVPQDPPLPCTSPELSSSHKTHNNSKGVLG